MGVTATTTIEKLRKANERAEALNDDLVEALVKEMRAAGASEDAIVRKLAGLISEPATLGDAILKSLDGAVGGRTLDPGNFIDTMSAAKRIRERGEARKERVAAEMLLAQSGPDNVEIAKLRIAREKRERRGG